MLMDTYEKFAHLSRETDELTRRTSQPAFLASCDPPPPRPGPQHDMVPGSRRFSVSSRSTAASTATASASYRERTALLEIRNGQEYMTILPVGARVLGAPFPAFCSRPLTRSFFSLDSATQVGYNGIHTANDF